MPIVSKLAAATTLAFLFGTCLIYLSFTTETTVDPRALNVLVVITGMTLGWAIGIVMTPYSQTEKLRFSGYTRAIGVFASGYLVGKIDAGVAALFNPDLWAGSAFLAFRVLLFFCSVMVGLLVAFMYRQYAGVNVG
ncbi:hypothetical protein [Bordetella sp. LUAb4]|uniref:hypothetical protein n=1 Tax=Bordetella sp. LUAb4 TaxID=2843195 RepID=UPI001E2AF704|nr:hypothetical protein [Bordetella sp. LUAb4]